jgi:hypothetical protein
MAPSLLLTCWTPTHIIKAPLFAGESVTLNITAEAFLRLQEPAYQTSTPIQVCGTAEIARPLSRLVVFDYHRTSMTNASYGQDYTLPVGRPFSISPGLTAFNSCFTITLYGDDNIEIYDKQLVIIIEPISSLDRVNFTADNITIYIEDNPSK